MSKDSFDDMSKEEEYGSISEQSDSDTSQNSNKISIGSIIGSIAVLVFFIADLIAMAIFSKTEPTLCIACLGSLLLVFGIAGAVQTKITWDNWIVIIFPIIGFLLTALPIADLILKRTEDKTIFTYKNVVVMVSFVFFTAGLLMIIMPFLKRHFMLKKCTETVMAKCVYVDSQMNSGKKGARRVYAPKWEYYIDGRFYVHQENTYTNVHVPKVGEEHEIFVDPNDPDQIYRHNPSILIIMLIMGIMFTAGGILTFYAGFFAQ